MHDAAKTEERFELPEKADCSEGAGLLEARIVSKFRRVAAMLNCMTMGRSDVQHVARYAPIWRGTCGEVGETRLAGAARRSEARRGEARRDGGKRKTAEQRGEASGEEQRGEAVQKE